MQGPGRPDIVNGPEPPRGDQIYSECRVRGDQCMQGPGRPDIVHAGSGETRYSECRVRGDQI
ncbi:unnamed protein product [Staurois parvus]|uniref:Uncharacterized protein n=1 Tax=Staurois parvus TaxID=386267 RepID=A0ABN9CDQ0_9NEOB|nr:unnamed protein product [Staurois parvus]